MQMTCILTLACVNDWLTACRNKYDFGKKPVTQAWHFRFVYFVILPSLFVLSIILSIYWAADVFNLTELTRDVFTRDFINTQYIRASLITLAIVVILWFVFNYINHTSTQFVNSIYIDKTPLLQTAVH